MSRRDRRDPQLERESVPTDRHGAARTPCHAWIAKNGTKPTSASSRDSSIATSSLRSTRGVSKEDGVHVRTKA